jgi:hypothetical protein
MKTYHNKNDQHHTIDADRKPAEREIQTMIPENPFADVAYEWNNALRIAVENMWGGRPELHITGNPSENLMPHRDHDIS